MSSHRDLMDIDECMLGPDGVSRFKRHGPLDVDVNNGNAVKTTMSFERHPGRTSLKTPLKCEFSGCQSKKVFLRPSEFKYATTRRGPGGSLHVTVANDGHDAENTKTGTFVPTSATSQIARRPPSVTQVGWVVTSAKSTASSTPTAMTTTEATRSRSTSAPRRAVSDRERAFPDDGT